MSGIIVVEDRVDMECVRHVHWMANAPISLSLAVAGEWVKESGVWHLRWSGPYRGVLDVQCEGWRRARRLVVWSLAVREGESAISLRDGLRQAAAEFERLFGGRPMYGFVRRMPRSAVSYQPSAVSGMVDVDGIVLLEGEWMLERCVAVGGRRF